MTMGFLTLAVGEKYRRLAANLLASYRLNCPTPLPFAVLTDRETAELSGFDRVILLESPLGNYLDKLWLSEDLPFDRTVFLDADCLAYGDLNEMFGWFDGADPMSCHGRVLPLEDDRGWFSYENLGPLQKDVTYCVGLHGGLYYLTRTEKCRAVFRRARQLVKDYESFRFRGNFPTPGDEPLIALAMALEQCRPIPYHPRGICCYWEWKLRLDPIRGKALRRDGQQVLLVHFGTRFTECFRYRFQVALMKGKARWSHDR